MPSWSVHIAVASDVFGISREVADEVNRIVDKEDFHDLGRRMPREPRLAERILMPEEAYRKIARMREAHRRIYALMSRGGEWTEAFWLHHALDFLAPRLTAAYIVNVDPERYEANLLEGVKEEMWPLHRRDPILFRSLNAFLETFRSRFGEVLRHPGMRGWARATADYMEAFWHDQSISDYFKPYMHRFLERIANEKDKERINITLKVPSVTIRIGKEGDIEEESQSRKGSSAKEFILRSTLHGESDMAAVMSVVMKRAMEDYRSLLAYETNFMQLMYRTSKFAAYHSHLIYYAMLLPLPRVIISELVLRVTIRRAAGLGREALGICRDITDGEERRQRIIRKVRDFERTWLSRRGISLPPRCVSDYADTFIGGYDLVTSLIPDPQHESSAR
ncbi:MAG: hypothetical protein J7K49_01970 [Thaumarchaeota archaeon]|nr:hypothetical protein [Nitrososphaerota archaeon]